MGGMTTIIQVKVTMTYWMKKGVKISFAPINEVISFLVAVYLFLRPVTGLMGNCLCPHKHRNRNATIHMC